MSTTQQEPSVGVTNSPANKPMNCNSWGTYEAPGTSNTAGYCNGGTVDGDFWAPCPSREECRAVRNQRVVEESRVRLPIQNQGQSQVRVVGQQPRPVYPTAPSYTSSYGQTTLPQRPAGPTVVTPNNNNPFLDTSRAGTNSDHSPTYLPHPEEHPARRLGANMMIGAMESVAHHVSSFLRNVDIFPFRNPKK